MKTLVCRRRMDLAVSPNGRVAKSIPSFIHRGEIRISFSGWCVRSARVVADLHVLRSGVHDTSAVNNALAMSDAMKGKRLRSARGCAARAIARSDSADY